MCVLLPLLIEESGSVRTLTSLEVFLGLDKICLGHPTQSNFLSQMLQLQELQNQALFSTFKGSGGSDFDFIVIFS
jgi:hypothetical protein